MLGRLRPTWPPAKPDVIADVVLVMALSVGLVVDILALLALGLTDHLTPADRRDGRRSALFGCHSSAPRALVSSRSIGRL